MNSFTIILSKFLNNIIIEDNKKIIHNENYYEYFFLREFDNKKVYDSNLLDYVSHKYNTLKKLRHNKVRIFYFKINTI